MAHPKLTETLRLFDTSATLHVAPCLTRDAYSEPDKARHEKNKKGGGKGKEKGGGSAAPAPKGKAQPKGKAKAPEKSDAEKAKFPCRFFEKGTCFGGAKCKYSHEGMTEGSAAAAFIGYDEEQENCYPCGSEFED